MGGGGWAVINRLHLRLFIVCICPTEYWRQRMSRLFWRIYIQPLRVIVVAMLFLLLIWTAVGNRAGKRLWWRLLNGVVFSGIVAAILYTTVFARGDSPQTPVWIPFHTFLEAKIQPELYRAMLMNVFLFVPVGLSLPNVLPRKAHPVAVTLVFAMLLSIGIEAAQLWFHLGRCETDDVVMNMLGAAIGVSAYIRVCRERK